MAGPALLIIDVQQGLDAPSLGSRNNPSAEANMRTLLEAWRASSLPVVHVKHDSVEPASTLRPELPGNAIKAEVSPRADEPVFGKSVNSAFVGTGLEDYLREHNIGSLVVVGLTTDHCVSASTRSASDLGFEVTLVADATATFDRADHEGTLLKAEQIHQVHLASLHGEFCTVMPTAAVLSALPS